MILEDKEITFSPPRTLAAREVMQAFFQDWLEDDSLAEEWGKYKIHSSYEIARFLEEYSVILAEAKGAQKQSWLEHSMNKLEELEKLQLRQRFMVAHVNLGSDSKKQAISLGDIENRWPKRDADVGMGEPAETEAMVFLPEIGKHNYLKIDVTDILRKGFTNARAFLNIMNLSEITIIDGIHGRLEVQLQVFKNQIYAACQLQNNAIAKAQENKALKDAVAAYDILLGKLGEMLVHAQIYTKATDACKGIMHMAEFLWSKNYERTSIHIQHSSKHHANILVFEPRFVKGSGNKEASWVRKLAKKHPWIKNLPWQVLQRPRPLANRDGEGLKIEKATLVSVKKLVFPTDNRNEEQSLLKSVDEYAVDCIPIGELGGIPVPFAINDLNERYRITLLNQKGVYLGSQTHDDKPPFTKLEEVIFTQVDVLAPIITKERRTQGIVIPLVDINLTPKIFPYKEGSISWLQDRADANNEIREILQRYAIYYDDSQVKYAYLDRTLANFTILQQRLIATKTYMPIHIEFCDPTIIYDSLKTFPCKTNEDINGLKSGLKIAVERLEMLKERLFELVVEHKNYQREIENISVVQTFLQSRSIGFFRSQNIPANVIEATRKLSEKLRRTECPLKNNPNSNRKIQVEILKILQSSLIVKSESFESVAGFVGRMIDNYFIGPLLIAPGNKCLKKALTANDTSSAIVWYLLCALASPLFATGWAARLVTALGATILKIPRELNYSVQRLLGIERSKSDRFAAAAGILFSAMGKKKLNCKSGADHALSVLLISGTMISRAINGELIDGKTPLMTDNSKYAPERALAGKAMEYQQLLKATGLPISR